MRAIVISNRDLRLASINLECEVTHLLVNTLVENIDSEHGISVVRGDFDHTIHGLSINCVIHLGISNDFLHLTSHIDNSHEVLLIDSWAAIRNLSDIKIVKSDNDILASGRLNPSVCLSVGVFDIFLDNMPVLVHADGVSLENS